MRALISVSDKRGIVEFASKLAAMGWEILSTGGTAKALREAGLNITGVSEVTGFPECLDGRVKTLHPKIHGGILGIRNNPDHQKQMADLDITPIDLLVINLYPFKNTILKEGVAFEDAIENIDIGGPTMLRSAAKNFNDVTVIVDPQDYAVVLSELQKNGKTSYDTRYNLALKVFETTSNYDTMIADYLKKRVAAEVLEDTFTMTFEKVQDLRYGENPHQKAAFYGEIIPVKGSLTMAKQLQGKELSYNNINDTNGALEILKEYGDEPTVVAVKHANPCGIASDENIAAAYKKAYASDPVSIYGGIIATNRLIDEAAANEMVKTFLEVIVAPGFTPEALSVLAVKPNLRLLDLADITVNEPGYEVKKVMGGLLVQERDTKLYNDLKVVTKREPSAAEMEELLFAWKAVKNTKSNAISLSKNKCLMANGPGQVSRIWALENAIRQAGESVKGTVMASDAFFPFDDCVRTAAAAGITAIIQPGGAGRDDESIKACDELGLAMVFTGMRHFKH
ncbi:bifunctional phosphoribosylaminoimidazolecarboxamide formyltransferase/IMP cyclohydrolase [Acetobacterium woodii]|uniref:Bifunctional purine biosynthesis protein PurH n=1 Tax=Acetobacterium woodii (strain ATCC 29683 / DSM 1030 / JCM 2381 / KCTC 1655 / WB1) TaxID=931626 RepID=H6LH83_ACEWD|nr:bifunctional phosphoribosylaminoimidazolecarboxamide formyltransferase/IMP cyclohydrolase [Acetobacterium woodii]AFA48421.1 bifunctional purine biosynthesis protein PurH [Acetobacterium woodii DSM 1030]